VLSSSMGEAEEDKRKDVHTKVNGNTSKMQTMWVEEQREKSIVRF
jgi:hypothetical protein